ncbi:MAG: 23S rRNA (uracil(1939)-C(5))-methyltransferase, partial [Pseudomonadota bacterium]
DLAMVERAGQGALRNQLTNTEYHVKDLTQPDATDTWFNARYEKVLLDPPRSGAQEIVQLIDRFNASRIVYVSCQASSLVRDAGIICNRGYKLSHIGVMDMFPQTAHIEAMAIFEA